MVSVINAQSVKVQSVMENIVSLFALSVKIQSVMEINVILAPIVTTRSAMVAHLSLLHHPSYNIINGGHVLSKYKLYRPNCTVVKKVENNKPGQMEPRNRDTCSI
jgi:hypothetical protein